MKKSFFILLVPLLFFLAHCNKDDTYLGDHTVAEGTVTEDGTGKSVANIQLRLRKCVYQLLGSSSCTTIDSTQTDANGFFRFDFKHDPDFNYEIRVAPDVERYTVIHNNAPIESGRLNKKKLILTPYAWIKLRIRNVNPFNQWDTIRIFNSSPISRGMYFGTIIDVTDKYRVIGTTKEYLGWQVSRNGQVTVKEMYLPVIPHDTLSFEIKY